MELMPQHYHHDQLGRLLSDTEFPQRVSKVVADNVIAHYEPCFAKNDFVENMIQLIKKTLR